MRKKRFLRYIAVFMALNIFIEVVSPTMAFALTSKYIQPELTGFEPANSSEMVDLFTGDFRYNIPLMDVDGYPLNIAYHAGQNMESEASWVGLGWSLNPGVLNRTVKGLPDDFNGENSTTFTHSKPYASMGVGFQFSTFLGLGNVDFKNGGVGDKISANGAVILTYNNHKGYGIDIELDGQNTVSGQAGILTANHSNGVGMRLSSSDGGTLSQNYSNGVGVTIGDANNNVSVSASAGEGTSVNTRTGATVKSKQQSVSASATINGSSFGLGFTVAHSLPAGNVAYSPNITNDYTGSGFSLSLKAGAWGTSKLFLNGFAISSTQISAGLMLGYKGYYDLQRLKNSTKTLPCYGYMYSESAPSDALMDFNRFRDGNIMDETPNINLTSSNYDIYSATAQGAGAAFRPFRSDIGVYHDNKGEIKSSNIPVETELGAGAILHFYLATSVVTKDGKSGEWDTYLSNGGLQFTNKNIQQSSTRFFEKYYFKQMGEIAARDGAFDGAMGGESPVKPILKKVGTDYEAFSPLGGGIKNKREVRNNYIESLTGAQASDYGFEKTYNLYDANKGLNSSTRMVNPSLIGTDLNINRTTKTVLGNPTNIGHHISEISMTNPSGSRYVYGIPVYNLYKKKVMFNASVRTEDPPVIPSWPSSAYHFNAPLSFATTTNQYVTYTPNELLNNNNRGGDNFYQHEITPAHATNYLLTSILSSDYVDIKGDGPTYDDLGNFTKFNYFKDREYGWREPFCNTGSDYQAHFETGMIADDLDDKAFYEYGIRENYYTHSIETKNYVAFFETSQRQDGLGVNNEQGTAGASSSANLQLNAIKLYSKSEILANGGSVTLSTPIKVVRFEYDYSLCPGTYNSSANGQGKLALRKIYFSYGNSEKSALSPYEFNYTASSNFNYGPLDVDRWGNYKPNTGSNPTGQNGTLNNVEFPYSEQDKSLADTYAGAWNLTEIKTPSGSKIKVTYESDDYGYVQNEQVGQMLKIKNAVDDVDPNQNANSYGANGNVKESNFLIIDLEGLHDRGISVTTFPTLGSANSFARTNLIKTNKKLYYKSFMKLGDQSNSFGLKKAYWDFVSGYATVQEVGVFNAGSGNTYNVAGQPFYKYAYVRLKKEIAYDSKDVFPLTIAGWDYMRNFLPRIAYPGSEPANMGDAGHKPKKQFLNMFVGLGVTLVDFVNGIAGKPNKRFYNKNFCTTLDYSKSFVRAYVPLKRKLGGGYRVKQIITEDKWDDMTSNQEAKTTYGQVYDYTIKEGKHIISSGVASYEPLTGGDEISLHQPIEFDIIKSMAPNDHLFQEIPYGEMMYPSPLVGYSKVTVTNLPDPGAPSTPNVCKIGKTEFEFYTAKDFPITYQSTGLSKQLLEGDLIEDFILSPTVVKIMYAVQGHMLKFNDMHGKLKAVLSYGEDNLTTPISGTRYFYKSSGPVTGNKQLICSAQTINEKNQISNVNMSRDIDLAVDARENINESTTLGNNFLLEIGLGINLITTPIVPCPPCVVPVPWPFVNAIHDDVIYGQEKFGVKTAAMTKVVQQYGILEKVESFDNKSKTTTENLLWDQKTGEVVLTKTTNNLDQPVYSFNYPAYWAYPYMGHEFRRDNVELLCPANTASIWDGTAGILKSSAVSSPLLFAHGDEVRLYEANRFGVPLSEIKNSTDNDNRFWVITDYNNTSNQFLLLDKNGLAVNQANYGTDINKDYVIKLVKPVDDNNLNASAGFVASITNPINVSGNAIDLVPNTHKIVNAGVQEFCSGSSLFIDRNLAQQSLLTVAPSYSNTTFNEIISGFYGTYRPSKSYSFNVDRKYTNTPNVSTDGFFDSFVPFWTYFPTPINRWFNTGTGNSQWITMNNNKYYSPYGNLMETQDAIYVSHAQRQCFNHTLPALSASNAKVNEVAFDSFEDYNLYPSFGSVTNVFANDYLGFYKQMTSSPNAPSITSAKAHTGRYALDFAANKFVKLTHDFLRVNTLPPYNADEYVSCNPYILDCSKMNFDNTKKYIVSMWVKGNSASLDYSSLVNLSYRFTHFVSGSPSLAPIINLLPVNKSQIINGWQKLDYEISFAFSPPTLPGYTHSIVEFTIAAGINGFAMDDFRIQPYNASMVCNVYDPNHLRMWAQLDDRNFATIMEYDQEGMLVRKKKETEKGIYTLQETRKGIVK